MAVLDTNVLIDLMGRGSGLNTEHARRKAISLIQAGETLYTTRINVAELWVGIELLSQRVKEIERVDRVLAAVVILEVGESESQTFGQVLAHLRRSGRPAGDFDALIAAVALANGQTIITRNPKHFVNIPSLVVETY